MSGGMREESWKDILTGPAVAFAMRILFLQKDIFPRLGALSLASVARKGGHICRLGITDIENVSSKVAEFQPDVVALSATSGEVYWARETSRQARAAADRPLSIIIGGVHPTLYPEVAQEDCFDVAVRGEADVAFLELLAALEGTFDLEDVPNIAFVRDGRFHLTPMAQLPNLDKLPFPAYDLLAPYPLYRHLEVFYVVSSRGCTYPCTFCYAPTIRRLGYSDSATYYRQRSVKSFIAEIKYLRKAYPHLGTVN